DVIQQTPHAVIMLEHIEHAPDALLDQLHDIFKTGYLQDNMGTRLDFTQTIFIISTELGSERLIETAKNFTTHLNEHMDLIDLVMSDHAHHTHTDHILENPEELAAMLLPDITQQLP